MDEELRVFAALSASSGGGGAPIYVRELAKRGVVSFDTGLALETSADIERYRPFFWAFAPPIDASQRNLAEFYCKSLDRRPAAYAGPDLRTRPRKLAVVQFQRAEGQADASPIQEGLRRCGAGPAPEITFVRSADPSDVRNRSTALDMKNSGITSVFCICLSRQEWLSISSSMDDVGYHPEVLLGGLGAMERPSLQQSDPYRPRMFGLSSGNKVLRLSDEPWYQAVREVDPGYPADPGNNSVYRGIFNELRMLATGIQAAGPRLTPATFEQGMFKAKFPNPNSASAPYWQSGGGFGPGDYTFTEDYALIYWSESAEAYQGGRSPRGDFCYVSQGTRWSRGTWPEREHPFFDPSQPCR